MPDALVEIWQCNAAGRYHHPGDQHDAPLDPNFYGGGRARADAEGNYRFITIKPGAYPWKNHHNAWRPAHIHFSLFGPAFATRLITQMYFPDDPLLAFDPIYNSVPSRRARAPAGGVRHGEHPARMGAGLPLRHRAARPQRHADGIGRCLRTDTVADDRPVLLGHAGQGLSRRPRAAPAWRASASSSRSACTTSRAPSCPTGCSRSGRPTATAATTIPTTAATCRSMPASRASAAPRPTPTAAPASRTVKPGRVPWPAGRPAGAAHQHLDLRPRPAQPAGDAALFRRRSGARRGSRAEAGRAGAARHADRQAGRDGAWRLPIHLGGPDETVFFDV